MSLSRTWFAPSTVEWEIVRIRWRNARLHRNVSLACPLFRALPLLQGSPLRGLTQRHFPEQLRPDVRAVAHCEPPWFCNVLLRYRHHRRGGTTPEIPNAAAVGGGRRTARQNPHQGASAGSVCRRHRGRRRECHSSRAGQRVRRHHPRRDDAAARWIRGLPRVAPQRKQNTGLDADGSRYRCRQDHRPRCRRR